MSVPARSGNRYDRMEWAGAFGDLGTLIPFVAAYIGVLRLDPFSVLFAFGASMLVCGLCYKTPFPVQPMKAIGAVASIQAVQTAVVTPGAVYAAAMATGILWLLLGVSGLMARVARWVPPAVVIGIVLGLGFGFMLQGVRMMQGDWLIAGFAAAGTLVLMGNRRLPAMFVLLALPQIPLTLGNAVIAITDENNRLFPQRPVTEGRVAVSTGLMNVFSGAVGGVPMCHGAGGMAAHTAFGARTGGSVVVGSSVLPAERRDRVVVLVCAGLCLWNVGAGFLVGIALHHLARRGLLTL